MKLKKLLAMTLAVVLATTSFGGCAKENKDDKKVSQTDAQKDMEETALSATEMAAKFPVTVKNDKPSIKGGTLKVALAADSAFAGVLNPVVYEDTYDDQIIRWFTEPLLSSDENLMFDQDGAATYKFDKKAKTVTLYMKDGVKWQDGEPVTLDDLVYAYEVLAHKDYQGFRYDEKVMNVKGVKEYHDGKADKISGFELSKDKMTLTIHFVDFYPSILAGGLWTSPIPRHYYKDVAVKKMAEDKKTRSTPIGFGPFKVTNVVPGESVKLERFDDYWRGKPKLDGVEISVIKQDLVPSAMKEGKYDFAPFTAQQYPDYKNPTNYQYAGRLQTVFSYTAFKLGKWNADKNENIYNQKSKMANVKLRQAIGYAVDNGTLAKELFKGLRFLATTIITPRHGQYQNTEIKGYNYDPEKAKKLLDEAGYKDVDGDGLREDPNGKKLTITWASMDGEGMEAMAKLKIQCWKAVGLNVELYHGRLTEFNAFYDAVQNDDKAIDMFDAAWDTGYNPNPAELWGRNSAANYTRFTSDKFDGIIKDISSEKAWDDAFRIQKYKEWQEAFFNEATAIPTLWRIQLYAINNRVKNFDVTEYDIKYSYHLIELTADDTIK